ncbi:MAG TPA: hypothetical protein VEK11_02960 [Thermoanaerobaculia bacterium]|nr:hypothetical protein [Thermoanaerobaculia bacterium]
MKRGGFLPIFFTVLAVFFGVAAWLRIRSYQTRVELAPQAAPAVATGLDEGVYASGGAFQRSPQGVDSTAPNVHQASRGTSPQVMTERERRYQELLNSTPPPAPPAALQEKPSLFQRMVTPIANALGMNKPETKPAPRPPQQQPQPQAQQASNRTNPSSPSSGSGSTDNPNNPQQVDDPETDIQPPHLLAATFDPPQIADGETTTFAVMVTDNLSGVRSVSGVITSPSGSMQGFACTREGETTRYVARVTVPADAADGVWVVKYLTLSDNVSNSVNLNHAQGGLPQTASFRVTSAGSDASGPQLKAVWIDRQAMRAGDKNTVFVQADDDKAGVSLVSGVFVSPSKAARIGFGCRLGSQGAWECPLSPPACLDCGVWRLEQIQLQDKANNLATFRMDNQLVSGIVVDISGDRCDAAPPVVTGLQLDPPVVSNAQASVIRVVAMMMDEGGCGVASLSGQAVPPGGVGGQRRYVSFEPSGDGQTYIGKLEIPQFAAKGQWSIAWIQALDKGHNLRAYSTSDPVVARATFRVE